VPHDHVATILRLYERFVFLPTHTEPFGRAVAEAWAAGCELIVNGNVGAVYWLEQQPDALTTAPRDFWSIVEGLAP
jgi:glycosyltransferase involved in cell wall biosynthesis